MTNVQRLQAINKRLEIEIGDALFSFSSYDNWCNKAKSWFRHFKVDTHDTICVDSKGRVLIDGGDFMIARNENTYPVTVYRVGINHVREAQRDAKRKARPGAIGSG